jgi:hypothetical protein
LSAFKTVGNGLAFRIAEVVRVVPSIAGVTWLSRVTQAALNKPFQVPEGYPPDLKGRKADVELRSTGCDYLDARATRGRLSGGSIAGHTTSDRHRLSLGLQVFARSDPFSGVPNLAMERLFRVSA